MIGSPTRKAIREILYQGKNIAEELGDDITAFSYNDPAEGKSDSISITIRAPGNIAGSRKVGKWLDAWLPQADDKVRAILRTSDWLKTGDSYMLDCGEFILDAPSGKLFPCSISLNGVSQPADKGFTETKRTQTWQNVTDQKIAQDIAGRAEMTLTYEGEPVQIKVREQRQTPDAAFLQALCKEYGRCMKVYSNRLVIYDRELYKKKPAILTLKPEDFSSLSFQKMQRGTYTGGKLVYNDSGKEEKIQAKIGGGDRILTVNRKADDQADAERILRGELNAANHGATTLQFEMQLLRLDMCSTLCVQVDGIGALSGKYFLDDATHGDKTRGRMSMVEEAF